MAKNKSKRFEKNAALISADARYSLEDAVKLIKQFTPPAFDPTVTLSFSLGIDPRKSDQMVRSSVSLPHGTGKNVRVLVFAKGEAADAATAAGAEHVGMEDLIAKVLGGFVDFDVAIATPDAMTEVRKVARVLGPRGLMPNPKTGTVTDDVTKAIAEVKAGRVDFKVDKNSNVAAGVGKLSFDESALLENLTAFIDSVKKEKPSSLKGAYIRSITVSATMCPGVKLEEQTWINA